MKRFLKYALLAAMLIAVVVTACSCGGNTGIHKPAADKELQEITGSCSIELLDENTIRVHGEANFVPETIFVVSIDSYNGEQLAKQVYTMNENQRFVADFPIEDKWTGPISASIYVTPGEDGNHPGTVDEVYGEKLQNVSGEHVYFNASGNIICIASEPISEY